MNPKLLTAIVAIALMTLSVSRAAAEETIRLFAAGSLKAAMSEMARTYEAKNNGDVKVATEFGASGLLRERIENGEKAHIFASADVGHPTRLADQGSVSNLVYILVGNRRALRHLSVQAVDAGLGRDQRLVRYRNARR